jgi:UDP-N-acetylglucosamine/UDP-N-acetylgalactosamine diphosphorylase
MIQSIAIGKDVAVPWYVMTSGPTRADTEAFFKKQNYFGMNPANVVIFEQGVLPAFTPDGKIILEDRDRVSVAPDGNGGVYAALRVSGVLKDMAKRGNHSIFK